jgi:hypothetical protein
LESSYKEEEERFFLHALRQTKNEDYVNVLTTFKIYIYVFQLNFHLELCPQQANLKVFKELEHKDLQLLKLHMKENVLNGWICNLITQLFR